MTQLPVELVGGPVDGKKIIVHSNKVKRIVIPVARPRQEDDEYECSGDFIDAVYRRRMEDGQPVTTRSGDMLFDFESMM